VTDGDGNSPGAAVELSPIESNERETRKPFRSISEGMGSEMGDVMVGIREPLLEFGPISRLNFHALQMPEFGLNSGIPNSWPNSVHSNRVLASSQRY
jgi:hypothetical protein